MVVTPSRVRPVSISSVDYFGTGSGGVVFFRAAPSQIRFFRDLSSDVLYARNRRFAELFVGMGGVVFSLAMCFTRGDSMKDSVKVKLKVKACRPRTKRKTTLIVFFPTFLWREVWWQALKRGCQFDLFDLMCKTLSPKVPRFAVVLCGVRTAYTRNSQAAYGILLVVCFSVERISPTSPDVVCIINVDDLICFRAVFHIRDKFITLRDKYLARIVTDLKFVTEVLTRPEND